MAEKPKEEKPKKTPREESTEATETTEPQPQPATAPKDLNREQLESLRRKLQKKFH
jgi:hypothetical protein